jgi:hypothetical protein
MSLKKLTQRRLISLAGPANQFIGIGIAIAHGIPEFNKLSLYLRGFGGS